jgi:hypothetical protein
MVLELLKTHWNGEKPLILGPGSLPAQLEWLGAPSD